MEKKTINLMHREPIAPAPLQAKKIKWFLVGNINLASNNKFINILYNFFINDSSNLYNFSFLLFNFFNIYSYVILLV